MDHLGIVRRAAETTWRYKVLWVFGILVALTTGNRGGGGNSGAQFAGNGGPGGLGMPPEATALIIGLVIAIAIFVLLFLVFSILARYLGKNALIQLVDEREETGEEHTVREGFRIGWSRPAWRIFLIDLVIFVPTAIVFVLLFTLALSPLLAWVTRAEVLGILGTIVAIGLFFLVLFLAIVVGTILGVLRYFFYRVTVLEGESVFASIREGFQMATRHLGDVALMWLLMIGIGIGWTILSFLAIFLLALVGALVAGIPALIVGLLVNVFAEGVWPWLIAGLVGFPLFFLVFGLPLLALRGIYETFRSTVWTMTYRELRAMESLEPELGWDEEPGEVEGEAFDLDETP